jgi:hypothetical protein
VMLQFGHKLLEIARFRDGFPFFFCGDGMLRIDTGVHHIV